ncbi:hypothetical protein CGZ98_07850 [Enemella evansiae]|nr:hypothetical protein CGZ98_07850 [Enemella evansiae]
MMNSSSDREHLDHLAEDWAYLVEHSGPRVRGWAERHPVLAGCEGPLAVLERIAEQPDATLAALLAEDAAGCPLAGRVVLQTMLPKLRRMARRDPSAGIDDYLAQLWLVIRRYPLDRRPRRIAANLALDTLKAVRAERHQQLVPVAEPELERLLPPVLEAADELTARRLIRAARRLGLIDRATGALLATVYAEGCSGAAAAERHHANPGAVRQRCHVAVRRMRAHAAELAEIA